MPPSTPQAASPPGNHVKKKKKKYSLMTASTAPLLRFLRTETQTGVWCSLLLPLLLWSAFEDVSRPPPFKDVTLVLSCVLSIASLVIAYHLVYSPRAADEGEDGVLRYLAGRIVSDLFERGSSREVRIQRKLSRQQKPAAPVLPVDLDYTRPVGWLSAFLAFALLMMGAGLFVNILALCCFFGYFFCLPQLFYAAPRSFTFGEGCIFLQALVLYAFEALATLVALTDDPSTISGSFSFIAKCGLTSCLLFCSLPLLPLTSWVGRPSAFLASGLAFLFGVTVPLLWWRLRRNPITWVLGLIFDSGPHVALFGGWFLCVLAAVAVVGSQPDQERASTRVRKYFHLLMVFVHTTGVLVDPNFLYLSTIVAVSVFALLEAIRVYKIQPFSTFLNNCFSIFLDEKDPGPLILTHIYLLCGCSLPLWISHDLSNVPKVRLLSGVLSVGIGDSAASILGSKFGRTKLPDSEKSMEGMVASVTSQLIFLWALQRSALVPPMDWTFLYLPVCIVSLVEALTVQVDNLVLPVLMYVLM